jgi:hypothetical protein
MQASLYGWNDRQFRVRKRRFEMVIDRDELNGRWMARGSRDRGTNDWD